MSSYNQLDKEIPIDIIYFIRFGEYEYSHQKSEQDAYGAGAIAMYNETLKKERWIPISERLPEVGELVLIYNTERAILIGKLLHNGWAAFFSDGYALMGELTALYWKPLPSPPNN